MQINAVALAAEIQDSVESVRRTRPCSEERFAIYEPSDGIQVQIVVTSDPAERLDHVFPGIIREEGEDNALRDVAGELGLHQAPMKQILDMSVRDVLHGTMSGPIDEKSPNGVMAIVLGEAVARGAMALLEAEDKEARHDG